MPIAFAGLPQANIGVIALVVGIVCGAGTIPTPIGVEDGSNKEDEEDKVKLSLCKVLQYLMGL